MLKSRILFAFLALLLASCFNSGFSAKFEGPVEIFVRQAEEIPVKNGETLKILKKGFDIIVRFHKNGPSKKLFVQFSRSDHFFKGLEQKRKIGEILSEVYPDIEKQVLNTAFLSGGMSGAIEPGNPSKLFFTSDYSNVLMYYQNESEYSFNSAETKIDYIECRYHVENFLDGQSIRPIESFPGSELFISFIMPHADGTDYDLSASASVKLRLTN